MSKKSPKLPMSTSGYREAKRQLKQREAMRTKDAKKNTKRKGSNA